MVVPVPCQTLMTMPQPVDWPRNNLFGVINNAVEAHSCIDTDTRISLVKQYTTFDKYLRAGRFDPKVIVNLSRFLFTQEFMTSPLFTI